MPGLLWIVEAVATGSKSVITKSMARWLQPWPENFGVKTAARKLQKKFPFRRLLAPTHGVYLPGIAAALIRRERDEGSLGT